MEVKIGFKNYKITEVDKIVINDCEDYMGFADHCNTNIEILSTLNPMEKFITLVHELMHCIENFYGIKELDEELIQRLSNVVIMTILDNPKLFKCNIDLFQDKEEEKI